MNRLMVRRIDNISTERTAVGELLEFRQLIGTAVTILIRSTCQGADNVIIIDLGLRMKSCIVDILSLTHA